MLPQENENNILNELIHSPVNEQMSSVNLYPRRLHPDILHLRHGTGWHQGHSQCHPDRVHRRECATPV